MLVASFLTVAAFLNGAAPRNGGRRVATMSVAVVVEAYDASLTVAQHLAAEEAAKAAWLARLEADPTWVARAEASMHAVEAVPAYTVEAAPTHTAEAVPAHPAQDLEAPIRPITSVDELKAELQAAGDDAVCVIKFFGSFCRTCRAIKPRFERVAKAHSQHVYLEVDVGAHRSVARHCGVDVIPHVQLYAGGRRVKSMGIGKQAFHKFEHFLKALDDDA
eukprot:2071937-Prymnesium_polylepis.1